MQHDPPAIEARRTRMTMTASFSPLASPQRFDRVAICSIHGDPLSSRTWSAAPLRIAEAFRRRGIDVLGIHTGPGRVGRARLALRHVLGGLGMPPSTEAVLRGGPARRAAAERVETLLRRSGVEHVLHMGTLDLPAGSDRARHYAYCDQTWALSAAHRPDIARYGVRALREFEDQERQALQGLAHVFTFGRYVRDHLLSHYGLPPERVTAVGSGMGPIEPYNGPKSYAPPRLLFVAKHLFAAKGGPLLIEAFRLARKRRPDLRLSIVGDERSRALVPRDAGIDFHGHLPLEELRALYRDATLLAQPMLNDPWGQVYLEALVSRTPVLGLARNGLPEITENGQHGFLAQTAEPEALAACIVDAVSDPARLARMGESGQRHVLANYSWERAADRIAGIDPRQDARAA